MRSLLTLMAMAVLVVSIGCDKKAAETTPPKADGDGAAAAPADNGDSSATPNTSGTQSVSLKLPGMT